MTIRVGIGGWTYAPWRGVFYPPGLPHKRELDFAARHLTAIEINGTFYSRFKPESFARWRDAAPEGFIFTVKGSRFCTQRRVLADAGEAVANFVDQGLVELGDKLGPVLWQLAATRRFDADDLAAFLALLPRVHRGVPLRHAIEAPHASFRCAAFVALARSAGVAIVHVDPADGAIDDQTGAFSYARLKNADEQCPTGYTAAALDRWAQVARCWQAGAMPPGMAPFVAALPATMEPAATRDVFVFVINGAKIRAPAAAQALMDRIQGSTGIRAAQPAAETRAQPRAELAMGPTAEGAARPSAAGR